MDLSPILDLWEAPAFQFYMNDALRICFVNGKPLQLRVNRQPSCMLVVLWLVIAILMENAKIEAYVQQAPENPHHQR